MSTSTVVDLSVYNPISDWKALSKDVNGLIFRIGYRGSSTGKIMMDSSFAMHAKYATNNNIPWGVYFFTTAINGAEGVEEAKWVLSALKNYNIHFPIFIDTEKGKDGGRSVNIPNVSRTAAIVGFCETIKAAGYDTGIYASDSWFKSKLIYSQISKYKKWVASYSKQPVSVTSYVGWQHTSNGYVDGSPKRVDVSYWYEPIVANPSTSSSNNSSSATTTSYPVPTRTLKKGSSGDDVKWLQTKLRENKYGCTVNGIFGDYEYKAVSDYQYKHGLEIDGIAGSHTIASLNGKAVVTFTKGTQLSVKNIPLYTSSSITKAAKNITKTLYLWDAKIIKGRTRITYRKESVGSIVGVAGWINYNDIKSNF